MLLLLLLHRQGFFYSSSVSFVTVVLGVSVCLSCSWARKNRDFEESEAWIALPCSRAPRRSRRTESLLTSGFPAGALGHFHVAHLQGRPSSPRTPPPWSFPTTSLSRPLPTRPLCRSPDDPQRHQSVRYPHLFLPLLPPLHPPPSSHVHAVVPLTSLARVGEFFVLSVSFQREASSRLRSSLSFCCHVHLARRTVR